MCAIAVGVAVVSLWTLAPPAAIAHHPPRRARIAPRPCDIYATAGTPCVAAFSSTRALFAGYDGPLYAGQASV